MKTTLACTGALLLAGFAVSYAAADPPPASSPPVCNPGCQPMACPDPCCDPCADSCKHSWNPFKSWFHHAPKVKEGMGSDPWPGGANGSQSAGLPGAGPNGCNGPGFPGGAPNGINSPVFPVHAFARGPRDFYMVDP